MLRKGWFNGIVMAGYGSAANVDTREWTVRTGVGGELQNLRWSQRVGHGASVAIQRGQRVGADLRTSRARRRRASSVRLGLALALVGYGLGLGSWWNPTSWWGSVANDAVAAWNDVKSWAKKAISIAVDMLSDSLDFIVFVFTTVTNAINKAADWWFTNIVIPAWDWIQHAAETVGIWIWGAIQGFYHDVILPALGLLHDALDFAIGALQYAINLAAQGFTWWVDHVIMPAWDWVQHAASTVAGWVNGWWDWIWSHVVAPLINDAEFWAHLLASAWDWLTTTVVAVVHVVLLAWVWLIWFGEHTFDDIRSLISGGAHGVNREWMLNEAGDPNGYLAQIMDEIARALG